LLVHKRGISLSVGDKDLSKSLLHLSLVHLLHSLFDQLFFASHLQLEGASAFVVLNHNHRGVDRRNRVFEGLVVIALHSWLVSGRVAIKRANVLGSPRSAQPEQSPHVGVQIFVGGQVDVEQRKHNQGPFFVTECLLAPFFAASLAVSAHFDEVAFQTATFALFNYTHASEEHLNGQFVYYHEFLYVAHMCCFFQITFCSYWYGK